MCPIFDHRWRCSRAHAHLAKTCHSTYVQPVSAPLWVLVRRVAPRLTRSLATRRASPRAPRSSLSPDRMLLALTCSPRSLRSPRSLLVTSLSLSLRASLPLSARLKLRACDSCRSPATPLLARCFRSPLLARHSLLALRAAPAARTAAVKWKEVRCGKGRVALVPAAAERSVSCASAGSDRCRSR